MIEFGNTLRQAREQKGLTTKQVAETTHMMVQLVEDLENERFSRIAAPIYGRGFVKLYCEAVGLDPKPLVSEFMEIFNGNRPATIRRREPAPAPAPALEPVPEPEPAPEVNEVEEEDGIIAAAADPLPPETVTAAEPPPVEDSLFDFAQRPEPAPAPEPVRRPPPLPAPSRYAAPAPIDKPTRLPRITIPPAALRFLALAGGAVILLWLLFAGIRAVVSALGSAPEPAAETPAEEAGSPRQPMSVPPLYID